MSLFLQPDAGQRFPISLLTGFLGSGKTTLLNRLIRHPRMERTAVVINEFGDVGLDQHFIERSDGEVTVLANGCVCCNMQGDLEDVVGTLFARRDRGDIPMFDRMMIETTGLADPAPIMQMILSQPLIVDNFRLDTVLTTVDAIHGARQLREHAEAVKQVALADRLVLTKTDIASGEAMNQLAHQLRRLNPSASMFQAQDPDLATVLLVAAEGARSNSGQVLPATDGGRRPLDEDECDHHDEAHGHLEKIATFTLVLHEPIAWQPFAHWLTELRVRHADQLLRVKGILNIVGEDGPIAIHGVHHLFHPPMRLGPSGRDIEASRIVFITRDLSLADFKKHWRAASAPIGSAVSFIDSQTANGRTDID